tara:strand:- start:384 stop:674 length:291 start_codon:yes stop_codon:yes gene_type:complete
MPMTEDDAINTVSANGLLLANLPQFRHNIKVVSAAVSQNGLALEFANNVLRNHRGIVMTALKQNPEAAKYIGRLLRDDYGQSSKKPLDDNKNIKYT